MSLETITDPGRWDGVLAEYFPDADIYFSSAYHWLFQRHHGVIPEAVLWVEGETVIFLPRLVRDLSRLPGFSESQATDLTTPYGYGGPLVAGSPGPEVIERFAAVYSEAAKERCHISEFVRFHPLMGNHLGWEEVWEVAELNRTVVIGLAQGPEAARAAMKKTRRNSITKSFREGAEVRILDSPGHQARVDFHRLYSLTMDRIGSDPRYRFSKPFLDEHLDHLGSLLIEVVYQDEVVGSAMFLFGPHFLHYHLSGAEKLKGVYPTDLMIDAALAYGHDAGLELLHLGGGVGSEDGLFQYKAQFSDTTQPFAIGKVVHDQAACDRLVAMRNGDPDAGFFPPYRAGLPAGIV